MYEENDVGNIKEMVEISHEQYSKDPSGFEKLLNDAEKPLYEGCKKFTKLSTLVKLYNLKVRHGWSNISFSKLLKALKDILPSLNDLPTSMYEAKKMLGALGMEYEKIHACLNDCCLYRTEYANAIVCPERGESRRKYGKDANKKKKIPAKIMCIVSRWKNPYNDMSSKYSCWPVVMEKVLENVIKEKKGIATSVPPVSLTSKKKVVEEEEVKEEEVIATTPMTKNEVKSSRPMTKEVELTSEPSNLPIQLKYILRYAERVMVDGSSFSFQLPLELFGISQKSYVLREDVIDFCNMQKVKTLSMVAYITYLYSLIIDLKKVSKYVFVDPSLISAGHSTREIRARNLCSRLMTSKQIQLVVAPYNPGDHWSLVIINPYDDVVYHLDSLRTSSRDNIKYVTNMALTIFQSQKNLKKTRKTTFRKAVGTVECGYYIMRYMREIMSKDTSIITDAIDTRNSYSQLEFDEVRVEWAEFLSRYI
ncbi:uncharacterized protein E6C27_scaffold518G00570 [Cucumis melo var. makuwa]|uniref:Ubiquitin-like protease family profile domain-containing protein n=1 Tax=Cucumis melo var. makuwa TaxID=1194695 RepID=A0A5A7UUG9_CUCMM|nr:uncharacterized protein E6C27_scaffold518G00570 [Cucumis melo var. makuwa]